MGKIGRENVAAMVKGDIEVPNDISGVVYIAIENDWKLALAKELRKSGYQIDMNKVV
jgi:predicted nucleotide-binding protein